MIAQEESHRWWREQWSRDELEKDHGGPCPKYRERMRIPSNLVGKDCAHREAGEYEKKGLETGGKQAQLTSKERSQLLEESGQGFSISPIPQHVDLKRPLSLGALTVESEESTSVENILKQAAGSASSSGGVSMTVASATPTKEPSLGGAAPGLLSLLRARALARSDSISSFQNNEPDEDKDLVFQSLSCSVRSLSATSACLAKSGPLPDPPCVLQYVMVILK